MVEWAGKLSEQWAGKLFEQWAGSLFEARSRLGPRALLNTRKRCGTGRRHEKRSEDLFDERYRTDSTLGSGPAGFRWFEHMFECSPSGGYKQGLRGDVDNRFRGWGSGRTGSPQTA